MARSRGARPASDEGPAQLVSQLDVARVRAVLALGGVPWDDLEDGVQQVRLKLLDEQARPDRPTINDLGAWVSVVASRVAVDWHRSRRRDARLRERLVERWSRHPSMIGHGEDERVLALGVADGLEHLSPQHRQVLTLRFYQDLTVRDIAAALELPEGTVKSRLHAATAAMGTRLRGLEVI